MNYEPKKSQFYQNIVQNSNATSSELGSLEQFDNSSDLSDESVEENSSDESVEENSFDDSVESDESGEEIFDQ